VQGSGWKWKPSDNVTPVILKHSFLSGHGSFLFWMRSDSAPPFLTLVPTGETHLEYWENQGGFGGGGRGFSAFIHSAAAGAEAKERGTNWRQPHTSLTLAPKGKPGDCKSYTFKLQTSGGVPPIFYGFYSPSWVSINFDATTGIFSGMTSVTGTFMGTVGAGDSAQPSSGQTQQVTLTVVTCP